jgi:hypothetical protein
MPKSTTPLEWCIVRLGEDHNWWVEEVSDPVRWDVDSLSIIDPRQVAHLIELVESLREHGFDQDISEEKLFALPDHLDEENGPYADLLDHLTRCRVKMLNELFDFESKLTIDEVEDQIREDQNTNFIEGKAVHVFAELTAILDFVPEGWDTDDERPEKSAEEVDDVDLPELDKEEEERLKNDASLKWDEDDDEDEEDDEKKDKDEEEDEDSDNEKDDSKGKASKEDDKPRKRSRGK